MSLKSVWVCASLLCSSQAAFTMAPKNNLMLNGRPNQELRQRTTTQHVQLLHIIIDEERDVELGIQNSPARQAVATDTNSFTQRSLIFLIKIATCSFVLLPKKTSAKKYQHGEFPV